MYSWNSGETGEKKIQEQASLIKLLNKHMSCKTNGTENQKVNRGVFQLQLYNMDKNDSATLQLGD